MIKIQLYSHAKDNTGTSVELLHVIATIQGKTGDSALIQQKIEKLRKYVSAIASIEKAINNAKTETAAAAHKLNLKGNQKAAEELKKSLSGVTWPGTFSKRLRTGLQEHSGLIVLDIDKLPAATLTKLLVALKNDPHTYFLFTSPSGTGIKLIFKIACNADRHKDAFLCIEQYLKDNYEIEIDPSGKDICRLCFLSYDPDAYYNPDSTPFELYQVITPAAAKKLNTPTAAEISSIKYAPHTAADVWASTAHYMEYATGNRNNFLYKYACNCNRKGIDLNDCISYAEGAANDQSAKEITDTIKSAYNHNANQHGQYAKKIRSGSKGGSFIPRTTGNNNQGNADGRTAIAKHREGDNSAADNETAGQTGEPPYKFWKEQTIKKGRGEDAYKYTLYKLSRVDFCDFLYNEGFHLLHTGDSEGFQIVHSGGGIIKPQTPQQIKHYALNWCKQYGLKDINEMLRTGQTKYFAKNELDSLPYKEVKIRRDTQHESFFYFKNCYVVVNDQGKVESKNYKDLDGYIWESNKINADYKHVDIKLLDENNLLIPYDQIDCEYAKFICRASYNPLNEDEKHFDRKMITDRFFSFCSAIGYLLDGYKHPSDRKGIFAIDHKVSERGEAHGRTGKSMIPQACNLLKRVATISGKTYDPRYQFCDEPITVDTQIINYNDMPRNFDVETIFEKIADPYSVNRRNQGFLNFTYENSPKVYYNTNYIPKGEGSSYKARMHVIEFSDYFNDTHSPYHEFGHALLQSSWDELEWQKFYTFMLWCVGYYKLEGVGLQEYPMPNIEARKLVNDVVPEFVDFIQDDAQVQKNTRLVKIDLLEKFNEQYQRLYSKKLTAHTFTNWLKKVCNTKGYILNPKQNGKHDKSNSVEYITIADSNYKN